jgi:3-oxoadipate enol-lactonase
LTVTRFEVDSGGVVLRGAREGEGPPIVLAHGLTAHRDLTVHGSRALPRAGYDLIRYDARGHGESDPGPVGDYDYERLADDLGVVVGAQVGNGQRPFLAGHSMGAHTIVDLALRDPSRVAGLVLIGPASIGVPLDTSSLANWDALADGLTRGGVDGFIAAYETGMNPEWHDTLVRVARDRLGYHRNLDAVAQAIREVPRSLPFDGIGELESLAVPTLVVASRDEADPGHPLAVAEAWAAAIPNAVLLSEGEGESPLAWQGGRLSREIVAFCDAVQRSDSR